MREICTSGSMSGEGKRSHLQVTNRALPRLYPNPARLAALGGFKVLARLRGHFSQVHQLIA